MREILLRGKTPVTGKWVEGNLIQIAAPLIRCEIKLQSPDESVYLVDPETVGQFTGLTDKNGKKIFENDILKLTYSKTGANYLGIVKFGEYIDDSVLNDVKEHIGFYIEEKYGIKGGILTPRHDGWESYEVIGNIYDNSELLQ